MQIINFGSARVFARVASLLANNISPSYVVPKSGYSTSSTWVYIEGKKMVEVITYNIHNQETIFALWKQP